MSDVRYATARDDTEIAYRVRGAGPTLVFARGWVSHLDLADEDPRIRAFFDRLESHFRVVRYDGRGNGMSSRALPSALALSHLVDDLEAVIAATSPDEDIVLWGSSWAGPAVIAYASAAPEHIRTIVLDGTFADGSSLTTPERRESFLSLLATAKHQPDGVYASMSYMTDPEPGIPHTARVRRTRQSIEPTALVALYSLLYELDVTNLLEQIAAPTLVLHRTQSKSVPIRAARELAEGIPGAELVALPGRDHNLWEGDTALAWKSIGAFLGVPELGENRSDTGSRIEASIVFVDQVGSTTQMRKLGDERGVEVQAGMIEMLAHVAQPFDATSYSDTGDGTVFFVESPSTAVAMAQVIQRHFAEYNLSAPEEEKIRLRVGVHAGSIRTSTSGRQSGLAIAVASRLCDLAGTDGIIVSEAVRDQCEALVGAGHFEPAETVDLKGVGALKCFRCSW